MAVNATLGAAALNGTNDVFLPFEAARDINVGEYDDEIVETARCLS
jgi:hypothetical protein